MQFTGGAPTLVTGDMKKKLEVGMMQERMVHCTANRVAAKEQRQAQASREVMGEAQMSKAAELRGLRRRAMEQLRSEQFVPGLLAAVLSKFESAAEKVMYINILCDLLATEANAAHRGAEGTAHPCGLCGSMEDGGETNFHLLWRCNLPVNACESVKSIREQLCGNV